MALRHTVIEQMRNAGWKLTREIPNAQIASISLSDPSLVKTLGVPGPPDRNPLITAHFFEGTESFIPSFVGKLPWEVNHISANSITLAINSSDVLTIGRNDSSGWNLVAEISIQSFDELHEVLEALLNAKPPNAPSSAFQDVRLSTLIDDVYFPLSIRTDKLYLVRPQDLRAHFPDDDIEQYVRGELYGLTGDSYRLFELLSGETFGLPLAPATSRDVVVLRWDCGPAGAYQRGSPLLGGIVLRLKSATSLMFMLDLLRNSLEGECLIRSFTLSNSIRDWLKTYTVSAPTDRVSQILHSMAIRDTRQQYLTEVQSLSHGREPLEAAAELFRKRRGMVSSLHNEMILQVESLVTPLPFFIEYPLAQLTGTSDRLQRIRYSQMLLNVLCKTCIFLPLEELQQLRPKSERSNAIAAQLRGRPIADGSLLDLIHAILDAVNAADVGMQMPVFGGMCESIARWRDMLQPIVAARNRLHHPPYDVGTFLGAADTVFPQVIADLRSVLSGIMVIIPKQVKPRRGKVTVSALKVMGASATFRTIEFTTSLSANDFVVDELTAYRSSPAAVAPLQEWFTVRSTGGESIDVGLFDRMKGDQAVYNFVGQ